jgi:hypothetical protein
MTRTDTTRKLARFTGLAAAVASIAMMVAPASGIAAAPVKFGAELNPTVQPSNSLPGLTCMGTEAPGPACSMVLNEAYGRPDGGEFAPKTGTIRKIRLIAGGPGSFKLQLAKVKRGTDEAKFAAGGPRIDYQGQTEANFDSGSYKVETFDVNLPVKKGQQLALRGNITSMIRCSSGGDNTLIYTPPLISGGNFRPATSDDGCWILMEAVIR